jgi:hypothetical protein
VKWLRSGVEIISGVQERGSAVVERIAVRENGEKLYWKKNNVEFGSRFGVQKWREMGIKITDKSVGKYIRKSRKNGSRQV